MKMYNDPTLNPYLYRSRRLPASADGGLTASHALAVSLSTMSILTQCTNPRPRRVLQVITPSRMSGAEMQLVRLTRRMEARGHASPRSSRRAAPPLPKCTASAGGRAAADQRQNQSRGAGDHCATRARQHPRRTDPVDAVHRKLVVRLGRSLGRSALDRPRARIHVGAMAPPADALAGRFQRRERRPCASRALTRSASRFCTTPLSPEDFYADSRPARRAQPNSAPTPTRPSSARSPTYRRKKATASCSRRCRPSCASCPRPSSGSSGRASCWASCKRSPERHGVPANVRFLGFRRDVADLMHAIDVMALPSRREPCAWSTSKPRCRESRSSPAAPAARRSRSPTARPACWFRCATARPSPSDPHAAHQPRQRQRKWARPATSGPASCLDGSDSSRRSKRLRTRARRARPPLLDR